MSIVELGQRHIGWSEDGTVVASLRVDRVENDVALHSLEYRDEQQAHALLEAVATVATAARMVGTDDLLGRCGFEREGERWVRPLTVTAAPAEETRAVTLGALEEAIRGAWSLETSDEPEEWTADNPATGQCAVTARVVRDYLGGDFLVSGAVLGGRRVNRHAWNRLPSGLTIDLTREQFRSGETFEAPVLLEELLIDRHPERYELLAARVRATLAE
jgi:hypothetical protein